MRRLTIVSLVGGALVLLALPGFAQQTPPPTCEQRLGVVSQLADDLSMSRRNAEIEVAMLKAQIKTAQQQAEAAAKTATPPKEPDARP